MSEIVRTFAPQNQKENKELTTNKLINKKTINKMKKVFLTIALAAFAFAANAQFVIGGNIGFNTTSGSTERISGGTTVTTDDPSTFNLTIMPKIGYMINDDMQVGLKLGFGMESETEKDVLVNGDEKKTSQNTITLAPYFRYNLVEMGDFKLFCEAIIPIEILPTAKESYDDGNGTKTDTDGESGFNFGIQIVPGLSYNLNDNVSFDLYVNAANIGFMHRTTHLERNNNEHNTTANEFGINLNTLPSWVTVGFNYAF